MDDNPEEDTKQVFSNEVRVMKLIEFRASEISMTSEDVKKKFPKLASQQLPYHMRRRSVSHNIKRLPKRLRDKRSSEQGESAFLAKKSKRPSRKYRRRPSNLLAEYTRRQQKNIWLETHIWFAKRFKMAELWGYKIAIHPTDKSVKAAYRATSKHCLMMDISYYGCLELCGTQNKLIEDLSKTTNPKTGLTFGAQAFISGSREGNVIVYRANSYPYEAIGPVTFHWMPESNSNNQSIRKLWIWCHPAIYNELSKELAIVFNLIECEASQIVQTTTLKLGAKRKRQETENNENENEKQNIANSGQNILPKQMQSVDKSVRMTLLKDTLNRFRLIGPLAQAVLTRTLQAADISQMPMEGSTPKWWQKHYASSEAKEEIKNQTELWAAFKGIMSSSELPPNSILGLTVKDPRLRIPTTKTKATPDLNEMGDSIPSFLKSYPTGISNSPIWNPEVRKDVKENKIPEQEINRMKNERNGKKLNLGDEESRIPLLLIQQPGLSDSGFSGGWDVIIPGGWSMAFWIPFIYREARTAGLRELCSVGLEAGLPIFPYSYPDTLAGQETATAHRKELMTKHFRYPPDKRPNFEKLGICSPFSPPWSNLILEWNSINNNGEIKASYYVMRERYLLKELQKACNICAKLKKLPNEKLPSLDNIDGNNALVFVYLHCLFKGTPSEFSSISLPTEKDFELTKLTIRPPGPKEQHHKPEMKEKEKTKKALSYIDNVATNLTNLVEFCDYKTIGFLSVGRFTFMQGKGSGLGFCTLNGLIELLKLSEKHKSEPIVLIRAQNSYQYRYAKIQIVLR